MRDHPFSPMRTDEIPGYIIGSVHETDRLAHIKTLQASLPTLQYVEAVYPAYERVPFISALKNRSLERTGHALSDGELGCLLSHRSVWRKIVTADVDEDQLFLILESDSAFANLSLLKTGFQSVAGHYDLFFWGAWEGHMKLYRSTRKQLAEGFDIGEPYLKSVYCTYGYAVNKKAAALLLKATRKVAYPVDQFKYFMNIETLRIGGVYPELIVTNGRETSYIQTNRNRIKEFFVWLVLDLRNSIVCYFK